MLFRLFTLLAVVALAISTWILSSPTHRPAGVPFGQGDLPGYYLKDAVLTDFDPDGKPSIRLEADRIDQVDHGTQVTLTRVKVDYQAPNGQVWTIIGDTGQVEPGGKVIDVAGHVRLQGDATPRSGPVIVHTDTLSYDVPASIATTPDDVHVDYGPHTLSAHGMRADLKERTLHLDSKVYGRFQPP